LSIHIVDFSKAEAEKWDKFIEKSYNGTIFHTRRFLSYHPEERFVDKSLILKENGRWLGVIPAAERGKTISSHPGASYGGIVLAEPFSINKTYTVVHSLLSYLRDKKFKKIEMVLPPVIYHSTPCNYLDFVLMKENFSYKKRELSGYIPLISKPFNLFKREARTATRKAEREGLIVKEGGSLEEFYKILEKNLKMRHNVKPTHTLAELIKLKELLPKKVKFFSSIYKKEQIAGTLLFLANRRVILAFYISHKEEFQHLRPVNILFYHVIKWAYKKHYKFLDLGTFTLDMEPNFGLARFKESLGARGIFRDYLELFL